MNRIIAALAAVAVAAGIASCNPAQGQKKASADRPAWQTYSELAVGETRHGRNIDTTVKTFEAGVPGNQAEPRRFDYYVADVETCIVKPTGESVLLSYMDFAVVDVDSHAYDLGMDIVYPGTVTNDGPAYEQREMSQGCNAGTITIQVPKGVELERMVLGGDAGQGEVAEWDVSEVS